MNRTLLFTLLFVVLAGLTGWMLFVQPDDRSTMAGWDRDFAVPETDNIQKIFIADRQGNQTTLERRDGYWLYNGQYKARPTAMDNLLDAVSRIEMKYKPPKAMVEGMVRDLATNGIKVEIYGSGDELLKAYYVGGGTADERGTHLIKEGAEQPYVGHLPGWTGNLRYRFSLKGDEWRDRSVFDLAPEEIQAVTVEYPKQKSKSFRLERTENGFAVRPFYQTTPSIQKPLQKGKVAVFLEGFDNLGAEAFENVNPRQDSVRQLIPFSIINVENRQGQEREVRLFPIHPQQAVEYSTGRLVGPDMVERYFADLSTGDFMLVQNRVVKRILWGYDFFFQEESG